MPEIASTKFVQLFQKALSTGGRLAENDVKALEAASKSITNKNERAAADGVMSFIKHDREFDAFEKVPVRKALGVLTGSSTERLPASLEKVLANGVPVSNVKVKSYDLNFDFSKIDATSFSAKAVITLEKKAGKEAILEVNPERIDVDTVKVNGKTVPFQMLNGRLHVTAPGATQLEVNYKVKPQDITSPKQAETAFGLIRDKFSGRMWTLTWPYNTGALFPSNSAPADGSTAKVTVKVTGGREVVGSGVKNADGSFATTAQAPAYAVAVYTAPKFELGNAGKSKGGVEVTGYGVDNKAPASSRQIYRKGAKDALDFYSGWLGKYDYGNTLKLVEVNGGLGGMEHAGAVAIMLNSAVDPAEAKETAAHETAHHWFGDNIRIANWGDFWMSEGFTNYATFRFLRADEGEGKYMKLLDRSKGYVRDQLAENPHALQAPPDTDVNEIFDSMPYEMGPWMLRMLEGKLGTPKFDALLKDWFQAKRQKEVTTQEFVQFAKQKTGQDFTTFFKEWNTITNVPSFRSDFNASGNSVTVGISSSKSYPASIEIPLELHGDGGKVKTVMVKPGKTVNIDAGFPVTSHNWDPERMVLADVN